VRFLPNLGGQVKGFKASGDVSGRVSDMGEGRAQDGRMVVRKRGSWSQAFSKQKQ
jgi:hypothetical protein